MNGEKTMLLLVKHARMVVFDVSSLEVLSQDVTNCIKANTSSKRQVY